MYSNLNLKCIIGKVKVWLKWYFIGWRRSTLTVSHDGYLASSLIWIDTLPSRGRTARCLASDAVNVLIAIAFEMLEPAKNLLSSSSHMQAGHLSNDTLEPRFEPLDCIVLADLVTPSNRLVASSSPRHSRTGSCHAAVEVHSVDTNCRIVLDPQINVLRDAEAEVASVGEVLLAQLVFLDFETALEDLFGFGASDCDVHGDLFIASDAEGADGVAGFACRNGSVLSTSQVFFGIARGKFSIL